MATVVEHANLTRCPACNGPATIEQFDDGDSLRCPHCDDRRGSFGELLIDTQAGGKLATPDAGNETLSRLRSLLAKRYGKCKLSKPKPKEWQSWFALVLGQLRDTLTDDAGWTREQIYTTDRRLLVAWLQANPPAITADQVAPPLPPEDWNAGDIANRLGVSTETLGKYAKAVGVETPRRGGRNHVYENNDVLKVLEHAATAAGKKQTRHKARSALDQLAATATSKPD